MPINVASTNDAVYKGCRTRQCTNSKWPVNKSYVRPKGKESVKDRLVTLGEAQVGEELEVSGNLKFKNNNS